MERKRNYNVKETVDVFNIKVDEKMLPGGASNQLKYSQNGLAPADLKKIVLGPVEAQKFATEEGNKAMMEKLNRHVPWRIRHPDPDSDESISETASLMSDSTTGGSIVSNYEGIASTWDEIMQAKNKGKYNAKKLKIIRNELDNLLKKADENDSIASSGNSIR